MKVSTYIFTLPLSQLMILETGKTTFTVLVRMWQMMSNNGDSQCPEERIPPRRQ